MKIPFLKNRGAGAARFAAFIFSACSIVAVAQAQTGTALVQHGPTFNGSAVVNGSIQQMAGETVTLNNGASISGDLLVPGVPAVTLVGHPVFGGVIVGTGSTSPTNYSVVLNGTPSLGHLRNRINPVALPTVSAPPKSTGTRNVTITAVGQSVGSFATLNNLTLNATAGQVAVPAGTYGTFVANGNGGFTLGVAGASQPAIYNLQSLTLNGSGQLQILGPVVLNLAGDVTLNGTTGSSAHPEWLVLKTSSGNVTINGGVSLYAFVTAPSGTATLNCSSKLIGGLISARLILNDTSLLRLQGTTTVQPPVAANQSVTTAENTAVAIVLSAAQANNDPLTYTAGTPSHGTLSGTAPNLTYTPTTNYFGSDSFTFTAKDGTVVSNTATVSITVTKVNYPPVAANQAVTTAENAAVAIVISATQTNNDVLTYSAGTPSHGALSGTAPNLTYTPAANYFGTDSFTFTAKDGTVVSNTAMVSITVTKVNYPPVAANQAVTTAENAAVAIILNATQTNNDALTYTAGTPSHGTLSGTAPNLTYTPATNYFGADSFTFTAKDGTVVSNTATVSITVTKVNYPPVAASQTVTTSENAALVIGLTATQANNDALTYAASTPSHGSLSGTAPNLTYTPTANYFGADSFTFTAKDGTVISNTATVSITVTKVNYPPVAANQAVTTAENAAVAIVLGATQTNNDTLTYTAGTPSHGTLSGTAPNLSYAPTANYFGADSFTFTAKDGTVVSNTATVSITVTKVNYPPVAANQAVTTAENAPVAIVLGATQTNNDALTYTAGTPSHGTLSGTAPNLTYTPATNYFGADSFTFTAADGTVLSNIATVSITVTKVNYPPVAVSQAVTTAENAPVAIVLGATQTNNDALTYTTGTPSHGTLSGTAPNLSYTPATNYFGADSFTFTAQDGTVVSNTATVAITVTKVNYPPVAANQSVTTPANVSVAISLSATQTNNDTLTYTAGSPSHGTLSGTAPSLTYTPAANYSGPDSFTFTASDGTVSSNSATVSITVTPVATTALIEIMMPANGCLETYARPSLGAHYAGTTPVQPDSFHVYLDGNDFSSEVTIDPGEVMFMPQFNLKQGQHNYRIDWVLNGNVVATDNTTFTVNSAITGTYFQGQVSATTGEPLVNVRVLAGNQQTYTDVNGKFSFTNLPVGQTLFHFQTDAVTNSGQFTPVNLAFEVLENQRTVWDRPIYLVAFDPSQGVMVQSGLATDQVVTNPNIPGVQLVIPANTELAFPDGSSQGVVTIVNVPVDRAPNCLGPGFRPSRLISVQPENTILSQPAQLTVPNDLNLPNGTKMALRNLDIGSGQLVVTGTATVVNNAVVTDAGSGLATFDWSAIPPRGNSIQNLSTDNASPQAEKKVVCSSMSPTEGSLEEDIFSTPYSSLGMSRTIQLHYNSRVAAPDAIVSSSIFKENNADFGCISAVCPYGGSTTYFNEGGGNYLNTVSLQSTRLDLPGAPTGMLPIGFRVTSFIVPQLGPQGGIINSISTTGSTTAAIINGAQLYPALGAGWAIGNTDRLVFSAGGTVLFVKGSNASMSSFSPVGFTSNIASSNLGFELNTLDGFTSKLTSVVQSLGFITPPEGKYMAQMTVPPTGQAGVLTLPIASLPPGTTRISLSIDLLSDTLVSSTNKFLTIGYNNLPPRGFYSEINETVLPGGDTGYARRTGFKRFYIDVPSVYWGQSGNLFVYLNTVIPGQYGQPSTKISAAALIDDIRFEGNPPPANPVLFYSGENGDYSLFTFDPVALLYQRTFKDGSKEVFDQQGREISSSDRQGNTTTYTYIDATGSGNANDLATVTDPVGLVTNFTYSGGLLSSISDPAGRTTSFTYNTAGQMIKTTNPDGTTRSFTYLANGKMASQSDGKGQTRLYTYGPSGRVSQVQRADGAIYYYTPVIANGFPGGTNSYNSPAQPHFAPWGNYIATDANGNQTSELYDQYGQSVLSTDAMGQISRTVYDSSRNPVLLYKPNTEVVAYSYDVFGNIISTTRIINNSQTTGDRAISTLTYTPNYNLVQTSTDPLGRVTSYAYDNLGNLLTITDPLGQTVTMTYNTSGQVLSRTDQRGKTTTYAYNTFGRLTSTTDPLGHITTKTYDSAGNVASVTDPLGHTTSYVYDAGNQVIQITAPDGGSTGFAYDPNKDLIQATDPLGHTKTMTYDVRRRMISSTDALNETTKMAYDPVDNLIGLTDAKGGVSSITYDPLNRKTSVTDPKGLLTGFGYDPVGNVVKITRPDGTFTSNTYDLLSRLTQSIAADGSTTSLTYDVANQLVAVTDPLNGAVDFTYDLLGRKISATDQISRTTQWAYDPASNLLSLQRPDGTATAYAYDDANRRVQITTADGGVTQYSYDAANNLVSLTDADNHTRSFAYDPVNRLSGETDPLGHTRQYSYDLAGNRLTLTRKDGATINYSYDVLNRLSGKTLPALGGVPADNVSLGYDVLGNLTAAANSISSIVNSYDADSLLSQTNETYAGNTQAISYAYDLINRRSQMTDALGNTAYTYDNRDRLTQLVDQKNRSFTFAYDALSRITSKVDANGITSGYTYDAASQLLSLVNGSVASSAYSYDNVGHRTAEAREGGITRNFSYDPVDRVLAAASSAPAVVPSEAFAYDLVGNWTVNSRQNDADNKLTSDASYNYKYDSEGNLTRKQSLANPSDLTSYTFDAENRLVQVSVGSPVTSTISYQYDARGRRIARIGNGVTTRYVLDGDNIRLELNSSNQIIAANTEAGRDRLLVRDSGTSSYFVHQDGLGSTTAITDGNGNVVERYRYSSFGQLSVLNPDLSPKAGNIPLLPETYTGREWDSDAGLYFYRARFYSPTMGRFISQDPIGMIGGLNYYAFCSNSPLSIFDPYGYQGYWSSVGSNLAAEGMGVLRGAEALDMLAINLATHPIDTTSGIVNNIAATSNAAIDNINHALAMNLLGYDYKIPQQSQRWACQTKNAIKNFSFEDYGALGFNVVAGAAAGGFFGEGAGNGGAAFADEAKLLDHFARHGADFGASTPAEYESMASEFLTGDLPEGALEKVRPSGDVVRYDPSTEEFGVLKGDGATIKTYYQPDPAVHGYPTNLDYFHAQ